MACGPWTFSQFPQSWPGPGEGPAPTRLTEAGPPLSISWEFLAGGSALQQVGGRAEPLLVPERQHRSLHRQDAGSPFWVEQMRPEGSPPRDARDEPRPGFWVSLGSSVGIHPPRVPRKPPRGRATSSSHRVEVGPSRKSWSFSQDCLPSVDLGPDPGNSYVVSGSSSEGPQPGVSLGGMEGLGC